MSASTVADDWKITADKILNDASIVVTVGPKKSGKSTFIQYMSDRICKMDKSIDLDTVILDVDCGQPIFTPPGFVSLHHRGLEDPNFNSLGSFYIGDTSPKDCSAHYLECIRELWSLWLAKEREIDQARSHLILVNTMGWLTGLGETLLNQTIDILGASHVDVVQFSLSLSIPSQPASSASPSPDLPQLLISYTQEPADMHIYNVTSLWVPNNASNMSAVELRAGLLCKYFGCSNILQLQPVCVPLKQLSVSFVACSGNLSLKQDDGDDLVWKAIDCSLVGLASSSTSSSASPPPPNCIGLGFVRAIDLENDLLYLVTPLSPDELERNSVNLLLRGNFNLPPAMIQPSWGTFSPYFVTEAIEESVKMSTRPLVRHGRE